MSLARPGAVVVGAVVVLAAGKGTRMRSSTPKVLHAIGGRSLLGHVLAAAAPLEAQRTLVVVGHGADEVAAHLKHVAPTATPVLQAEQLGTGHAVKVALDAIDAIDAADDGTVVVLNGDVPLLTPETLAAFVADHVDARRVATVLTADVADPAGLGRIVRDSAGGLAAIVEERDCTPQQRQLTEINAGIYAFDGPALRRALASVTTANAQGEQYLTDVVRILAGEGRPVGAFTAPDPAEASGCNDRAELARLGAVLRDRVVGAAMRAGVTVVDPATTWIDVTAVVEPDATIHPQTQILGSSRVHGGATVGPDTTLVDTTVGAGATVVRTHGLGAEIGSGASVGPFAYLRPGTTLGRRAKIGTFVETKNADIGDGTKVPHLSYVGDATIGEGTNIGAATVFVNYDGIHKHHTTIGSHARTGADNMFVAPVSVGDGAYTAAGSVITEDVPPGAMAVARGKQRNVEGWVERRRPGTAAADAATRAKETHARESQQTKQ